MHQKKNENWTTHTSWEMTGKKWRELFDFLQILVCSTLLSFSRVDLCIGHGTVPRRVRPLAAVFYAAVCCSLRGRCWRDGNLLKTSEWQWWSVVIFFMWVQCHEQEVRRYRQGISVQEIWPNRHSLRWWYTGISLSQNQPNGSAGRWGGKILHWICWISGFPDFSQVLERSTRMSSTTLNTCSRIRTWHWHTCTPRIGKAKEILLATGDC